VQRRGRGGVANEAESGARRKRTTLTCGAIGSARAAGESVVLAWAGASARTRREGEKGKGLAHAGLWAGEKRKARPRVWVVERRG
jgi:hypothetical protein